MHASSEENYRAGKLKLTFCRIHLFFPFPCPQTQIARLKESVDKLQTESALLRTKEQTAQDAARRLQRSLRDARDEASAAISREQEAMRARRDIEKSLDAAEAETKVARDDLRLALQRIDDLQSAIQGELDLDCSEEATSENSDR